MITLRGCVQKCNLLVGALCVLSSALWGQAAPQINEKVNNADRVTLTGNVHPLARAESDRGAVSAGQPMTRMLLLLKRTADQEAALRDFLEAQQDKSSPNYHRWLTPEQFGAQFGPADADIQTVTQWLQQQGFTVDHVYAGKTVVEFSGSANQVQAAFGTGLRNYQVNGHTYVANANDPQIPAALAPVVAGIVSLNNFPRQSHVVRMSKYPRRDDATGPGPLYTAPGGGYYMAPGDFATIYNASPLYGTGVDGTGQTIAIVGETNISVADVQNFRTLFNLPSQFSSANVILNGADPGITSVDEETEADLDVQWSGATAPGATVDLVVSASTAASSGIDLSALYIIEHNLAGVMSESYGSCESALGSAGNAFYNSLWEQAASQGITAIVSAGDDGSAGCDNFTTATTAANGLAVNGLASTPFNVAVGGTDFDQASKWSQYWNDYSGNNPTTHASALGYIPEMPWNDSCAVVGVTGCTSSSSQLNIIAGGGGPSSVYTKPSWQVGITGMPNDNHRDLPDVSLFSGNGLTQSAYIVCQADATNPPTTPCALGNAGFNYQAVGGTSAAAPSFAGIMALVNQKMNSRQGNPNYVLYGLAKKAGATCNASLAALTGNTCMFYDVTKNNNSVPCSGGSPNCSSTVKSGVGILVDSKNNPAWIAAAGYDTATGLGSVNVKNLVNNWSTANAVATATTLTLSQQTGIVHGNENVPVSITVTPTSGKATGDVALLAKFTDGSTQGLDQFTLTNGSFSGTTQNLPGGTYQVYAHYAGDGTNAPSDSAPATVTVTQESSKTFIVVPLYDASTGALVNGNASSVPYASPYRLRIYVTNSSASANPSGPPSPTCDQVNETTCPTGTVLLTGNGTGVDGGTYNLNNMGYTRDVNPTLGGGTYSLVAQYSGDSSYTGSTSPTVSLTVTPATTRILPSNPPLPPTITTPFEVGIIVTMNVYGAMPACNVTFYDGKVVMPGTPTCNWQANGPFLYAYLMVNQTTPGSHTYSATFNGDANYAPSTSTPATTQVHDGTTTTLTADSTTVPFGSSITLTAVVDSTVVAGPAISQAVSFSFNNNPVSGTVTYTPVTDGSGNIALRAVLTTTPQSSGFYTANFAGDSNYGQSGAQLNVNVNIQDFSLASNPASTSITAGGSATATITVTPAGNGASPVTLTCPPFNLLGQAQPPGIACSFSPGTVNLSNGSPATATLTISSLAPSSSTTTSIVPLPPPLPYMAPRLNWPAAAASLFALLLLLLVPFRLRGNRLAPGMALALSIVLLLGFGGCGGGSTGGGGGGGGGPVPSSITLSASSVKVPYGSTSGGSVNLTANVTSSKTPGGTVTFIVDGNSGWFASPSAVTSGVAQIQLSGLTVGVHTVAAQYSGDSNTFASKTNGSLNVAVTGSAGLTVQGATGGQSHGIGLNFTLQ